MATSTSDGIVSTTVSDKLQLLLPLLQQHWEEVALNKGVMVLNPNVAAYQAMEAAGVLIGLLAYKAGEVVGYAITVFSPSHPHYAGLSVAVNDVIFVDPKHRGAARIGLGLIRETERIAAERGARLVLWHAKPGTAFEHLLPRLGYGVQDVVFSREVN